MADRKQKRYYLFYLLWGMLFMGCATLFFVEDALSYYQSSLGRLNGFVARQMLIYSHHNSLSLGSDIFNVSVLCEEAGRDIAKEDKEITDEMLCECARSMSLDGIIVMDASGGIVSSYNRDGVPYGSLIYTIDKESIRNASLYRERIYTDVVCDVYGGRFTIAAIARSDMPGVIVCYRYIEESAAKKQNLTIQKLLSSYQSVDTGTMIISDGTRILAATDEALVGTLARNNDYIKRLQEEANAGKLTLVDAGDLWQYGIYTGGRGFFVYNLVPTARVFANLPRNLLLSIIFLLAVFSVMQLIRMYTLGRMKKLQEKRSRKYRKKLEETTYKAQAASRAKTEFLQRMSHDIRTPINGIIGMVEVAEYYQDDMAKQAECRKKVLEASEILLELVNEVLDMGKLESGEIYLERRSVDLEKMLDTLKDILEKQAAAKGITITKETAICHKNIQGSPIHLKRLYMNIMSNAVKYNKPGGRIYISCKETSCRENIVDIEFVCRDTGVGMSEEFQKHAFDAFAREQGEHTRNVSGTGLGMSIAKSLAEKMGGTLELDSKLGRGTTIKALLPLELDPVAEEKKQEEIAEENPDIDGVRILLVEDNDLNMEIADFVLKKMGAKVAKAHNGKEALDTFAASKEGSFDGILMDIMMPVMNGYEAAEAIRSLERKDARMVPIIAMTANAFTDDRRRAYMAGMNEHLAKPLDKDLLLRTLYRLCRQRR